MKLGLSILLAALAVLFVACGGDDDDSASPTAPPATVASGTSTPASEPTAPTTSVPAQLPELDPCSLLTAAEVATALSAPVADIAGPERSGADCVFDETSDGQRVFIQTGVRTGSRATLIDLLESIDTAAPEPVDGFGDIAYKNSRSIGFIKSNRVIAIGVTSKTITFDAITTLAEAAYGRAP